MKPLLFFLLSLSLSFTAQAKSPFENLIKSPAEEAQAAFEDLIHGPVMTKAESLAANWDEEVKTTILENLLSFSGSYLQYVDSFCKTSEGCRLRQFTNVNKALNAFLSEQKNTRKDLILSLREPVSLEDLCGNLSSRSQTLECADVMIEKKEKSLEQILSREKFESGLNMAIDYSTAMGFIESKGSFKAKEVIDSYYFQLLHYVQEQGLMVQLSSGTLPK